MQPFTGDLFKGMLAFFLLDMGLMAARTSGRGCARSRPGADGLCRAGPAGACGHCAGAGGAAGAEAGGNAALLMVLSASASYIVVPAVLRHAMPEANPSLYLGLSLGMTFPLNILLGIPLYIAVARWAPATALHHIMAGGRLFG
jgi:hypothetical protein